MFPLVSIVIPIFNVEDYLPQCIDSVLNQAFTNFEVILIDDGSTDTSGQLCDNYATKDNRIRVIHTSNNGVSIARNTGIHESKGEWICFVDSDDFVDPDFLSNFYLKGNDSDVVIQGLELYHNQENRYINQVRVETKILEPEDFKQSVENNRLLHIGYPTAKAYRKRLLLESNICFKTNISFHEDHIFVLEFLRVANRIQLIDSISYKYRVLHSNNSLSRKRHSWKMLNDSADQMLQCLDSMSDRFLLKNSTYENSIYTFAYYPKIEAVYELFRTSMNCSYRNEYYNLVIKREQLKAQFKPEDVKHKFIKFILVYMPYFVILLFMSILTKWQSKNI